MKFFDFGEDAVGFIAIGSNPVGVIAIGGFASGGIAIGWMSYGVIAVGQISAGIFTAGQATAGLVSFGQAALGVIYGIAQIGVMGYGNEDNLSVLPDFKKKEFSLVDYLRVAAWLGLWIVWWVIMHFFKFAH
ncbi:MAG: hypothetical protein OEZ34_16535 [Spirochaetia bacterium]|nr:hypothetical protein [Spirochaetia bacterium]